MGDRQCDSCKFFTFYWKGSDGVNHGFCSSNILTDSGWVDGSREDLECYVAKSGSPGPVVPPFEQAPPLPPVVPVKSDEGKTRTDLLPVNALLAVAGVFGHGARKYSDDNYLNGPSNPEFNRRLYAAALRHLFQWKLGNLWDEESGRMHLAHAACCVLMLVERFYHEEGAR